MRQSNGQYAGTEMASFGLLTGYTSLILMGLFLALGLGITETSRSRVVVNNRGQSASEVLLDAAEAMLLRDGSPATFSNDAANGDAAMLAAHFVETLAEADSLLFAETNDSAADSARTYRAFVQLNDDSCAVLLCVPELERFTESARKTLAQVAWLTAQRTIESTLAEGNDLAVALYRFDGLQTVMIGEVRTSDEFDAGLKSSSNDRNALIRFFPKPARRESRERVSPAGGDDASMIDTNPSISELPDRE